TQVGVLYSADADGFVQRLLLGLVENRHVLAAVATFFDILLVHLAGARYRLIEQGAQLHRPPFAGLERLLVFAKHRAEGDMLQGDVAHAPAPGGGKQVLKVERLPKIDDVKDRLRLPGIEAITNGRQIAGRVRVSAVVFLHQSGRIVQAKKNDQSAV